ncbi:MAG: hypothetical protein RLZZ436_3540, partial [Planctomycetota bacterium]
GNVAAPALNLVATLQSARDLLKAVGGDVAEAQKALALVASLQMG